MSFNLHYHRRDSDDAPESLPEGAMTQEQLDFFTEQTQRAVKKGVARYRREALVGFGILLIGLVVALADGAHTRAETDKLQEQSRHQLVLSGRAVAVESCNRDFLDRKSFRALLITIKQASEANTEATPAQKKMAREFYDSQLKLFTLPDCRQSDRLLTDNPAVSIPVIAPYYQGAPYLPEG